MPVSRCQRGQDHILTQDESLEAAEAITAAQQRHDNATVDQLIRDIQTASATKKVRVM